jgi:hypothetical protein
MQRQFAASWPLNCKPLPARLSFPLCNLSMDWQYDLESINDDARLHDPRVPPQAAREPSTVPFETTDTTIAF